jgi:hypothetical protein
VSLTILQRTIALAAVALVACVATLALTGEASDVGEGSVVDVPVEGETTGAGWYTALAGSRGPARDAEQTTCRHILTGRSLGVTHPVLPCGAKIFISYGEVEVLTEVIDTKLKQSGRQFELTEALAQQLGLEGTQQIRWRFATSS